MIEFGIALGLLAAPLMPDAQVTDLMKPNDKLQYPETRRQDVSEMKFGVRVEDPYRWLENPDEPDVRTWIEAQNKLTFEYLGRIPERTPIKDRLRKVWNYERFGIPEKKGSRYFWTKNDGLQNQSVLYWATSLKGTPKVLLDPNKLSKDGTVALSAISISHDGKYLAYAVASGGSDWQEWRVRRVDTGADLPDRVRWSKFSGASWTKDNKGFYYSRYEAPKPGQELEAVNYFHKLYYHKINSGQEKDTLIYERKDKKEWGFDGRVTDDGRYLLITVWEGTKRENRVFYKDLGLRSSKVVELLKTADASYGFIGNSGTKFWFQTDLKTPRGRVIEIDIKKPETKYWKTILPEAKEKLESVSHVGRRLVAQYLKDAHSVVKVYSTVGKLVREVKLPVLGSAGGFGGKYTDTTTYFDFQSFAFPRVVYSYAISTGKTEVVFQSKVDVKPADFETKQIFYHSKDGTLVPMFLVYRKGLKLDGASPTLLSGYGGFNISQTPYFSVSRLTWVQMGGVLAIANIRGGGEYGTAWHDAGRLKNKQNCFDDFISAAEWLIDNRYTSPSKLAIQGGSNGGLLVGACVNQRPDLFGAALPAVGVMDMLRFHKWTIGWAWVSDYGSPEREEDFKVLFAYSPYHNVTKGAQYPAVLVTTGDHDDRVVPAHSFKYAAAMQSAQAGDAPILIRIETRAGHGAGKPTDKIIDEVADTYAFLVKNLGLKLPANFGK